MKNKQVKKMMVDIERNNIRKQLGSDSGGMWIEWFDGVCIATSGGNFLWPNKAIISIINGVSYEKHTR